MPRNSLNDGNQRFESSKGDEIINDVTQETVSFVGPDGNVQEFVTKENVSRPDENGIYIISKRVTVPIDASGNTFVDPNSTCFTWSGLFAEKEHVEACSSWFHLQANRNFLPGQDGHMENGKGICGQCLVWVRFINIVFFILFVGVGLGVCKGVGLF